MAEFTKSEFNKKFPNLAKELGGKDKIPIQSTRTNAKEAEKKL